MFVFTLYNISHDVLKYLERHQSNQGESNKVWKTIGKIR